MKQYVIWFTILHLVCYCENGNIDYSDFHPESVPLRVENPSIDYKEVMKNLCDSWHSPISYLEKRGYMPNNIEYKARAQPNKKSYHKNIEKGDNYFFFPDSKEQRSRNSVVSLENDSGSSKIEDASKTDTNVTELPPIEEPKNDTTGIINKVKDKFLSIFSHKNKSKDGQLEAPFDLEDPEFLETYNDEEYDISDRRIFARSVSEKPLSKHFNSSKEGILSNLTEAEIHFVKSFIDWFKLNKDDLKFVSSINKNSNSTTSMKNSESKDIDAKSSSSNSDNTKPTEVKSNVTSSSESEHDKKVSSTTKPVIASSDCLGVGGESPTGIKSNQSQRNESVAKNTSSKTGGNDFTVDLDINQKNGTGEEICPKTCTKPISTENRNKYITKSKFLAHLHHMVDEVGKPPHKPLDLTKVQDIIDKSKKLPTVTMGGGLTTQCAPLRLNDMSFELEWNKINSLPQTNRDQMNFLDLPYINEPREQSLAAKFLKEANSYPGKSGVYLNTPYSDTFLEAQQSVNENFELPVKSSTKREVGFPWLDKNEDNNPFKETDDSPYFKESPKRRIKGRIKGRNRKKPKHKNDSPSETLDATVDLNDDMKQGTDFDSFDELKDIQFRVSGNDEEAISAFITNLNSPPEVFSFDVDKYLKSAKQNMEPKAPELDFQSPETKTYYEFLDSPAVENERLPLIEAPSDTNLETVVDKRSRSSPEKRDLLRQYIKGVSGALSHNFENIYRENCNNNQQDKLERSPNLDSEISSRTNDLMDEFSVNLNSEDPKNEKKENDVENYYFLPSDGYDQIFDLQKQNLEVLPKDYSPQSLEIDLDLDNKFRDLNIGRHNNDLSKNFASVDSKNVDKMPTDSNEIEASDWGE